METINLSEIPADEAYNLALYVLHNGGLVVYPTETCYGLGADATNPKAIQKLIAYKRRREGKPLSVLVSDQAMAEEYVALNDSARKLYKRFLPGPLTIISKDKGKLAPGVASELKTVGIRISSHLVAMELVKRFGKPITATSANASWKKKPYTIKDVLSSLTQKQSAMLDLLLDAGTLPTREASTVIDTTLIETMVLRQGDVIVPENSVSLLSDSETKTQELAVTLMLKYWNEIRQQGLIVGLIGDLGTGKTVFAKGVGKFLNITDPVISPSYTLVNEYLYNRHEVNGIFYHLDPWRLESFADLEKIGINGMLKKNNVVVIEWASKFQNAIVELAKRYAIKVIMVNFKEVNDHTRELTVIE